MADNQEPAADEVGNNNNMVDNNVAAENSNMDRITITIDAPAYMLRNNIFMFGPSHGEVGQVFEGSHQVARDRTVEVRRAVDRGGSHHNPGTVYREAFSGAEASDDSQFYNRGDGSSLASRRRKPNTSSSNQAKTKLAGQEAPAHESIDLTKSDTPLKRSADSGDNSIDRAKTRREQNEQNFTKQQPDKLWANIMRYARDAAKAKPNDQPPRTPDVDDVVSAAETDHQISNSLPKPAQAHADSELNEVSSASPANPVQPEMPTAVAPVDDSARVRSAVEKAKPPLSDHSGFSVDSNPPVMEQRFRYTDALGDADCEKSDLSISPEVRAGYEMERSRFKGDRSDFLLHLVKQCRESGGPRQAFEMLYLFGATIDQAQQLANEVRDTIRSTRTGDEDLLI